MSAGNDTEEEFSLTTDMVLMYGGQAAPGASTSDPSTLRASLLDMIPPSPVLRRAPASTAVNTTLGSVRQALSTHRRRQARAQAAHAGPGQRRPPPANPTTEDSLAGAVSGRRLQQAGLSNTSGLTLFSSAYIATWQPAAGPAISASLPSGTAGYMYQRLSNSNGSEVHSPGPRAGAALVSASDTEALLFGGLSQDQDGAFGQRDLDIEGSRDTGLLAQSNGEAPSWQHDERAYVLKPVDREGTTATPCNPICATPQHTYATPLSLALCPATGPRTQAAWCS